MLFLRPTCCVVKSKLCHLYDFSTDWQRTEKFKFKPLTLIFEGRSNPSRLRRLAHFDSDATTFPSSDDVDVAAKDAVKSDDHPRDVASGDVKHVDISATNNDVSTVEVKKTLPKTSSPIPISPPELLKQPEDKMKRNLMKVRKRRGCGCGRFSLYQWEKSWWSFASVI